MAHQVGPLHAAIERSAAGNRRFERETIRKNAFVHSHDRTQSVLIRDISCGGMKIQNAFGLMPGDAIMVEHNSPHLRGHGCVVRPALLRCQVQQATCRRRSPLAENEITPNRV